MNLKQQFIDFKTQFDYQINQYLEKKIEEAYSINPSAGFNLQEFQKLIEVGGKRVRPALVHFTYLATGRIPNETVAKVGMALEIFHTFALIHDDIIDESLVRRGFPTMEASYRDTFTSLGLNTERATHYARSAAILGGDYGLVLANQIMSELDIDLETKDLIQRLYSTMQFELCAGQIDDCFGIGLSDWDNLDIDRIDTMLKTKSGNYSIQKPMLLGGLLAKVNKEQYQALSEAGQKIGLVYQISDDILGVFGQENETGKSVDSDIIEGKRNLLLFKTYASSNDEEKKLFKSILGNPQSSQTQIEAIRTLIRSKGIVDQLQLQCQNLVSDSITLINRYFDKDNNGTQFINNLAQYLLTRKS